MDSLINGFIIADYPFREKNDLSTWLYHTLKEILCELKS